MLATVGLALGFRKSDNLAAAYGIAVSATMLLTSLLLFIAMREVWKWNLAASLAVASVFVTVDGAFLASNLLKVVKGGWVPLLLASAVYLVMYVWHRGILAIAARVAENPIPVGEFMENLARQHVARVPGTAVFLTRVRDATPVVLRWYVKRAQALHERVIAITLETASVPRVATDQRLQMREVAPGFWSVHAAYGFMERPDMPQLIELLAALGCGVQPDQLTYFVGAERVIPARRRQGAAALDGAAVRRAAAQLHPPHRLPADPTRAAGRARAAVRDLELHHHAGTPDDLARLQVREPDATGAGAVIRAGDAAVVTHERARRAGVAERRRHAARTAPVRHVGMAEGDLGPPGDPVLGHVLEVQLGVPLVELLPGIRGEVRRTSRGGRAIDGRQQREITAGVVHEAAAEGTAVLFNCASGLKYPMPAVTARAAAAC
jgi:hypothetical protein